MLSIDQLRKWAEQQLLQLSVPYLQQTDLSNPVKQEELSGLASDFALHSIAALINDWYEQKAEVEHLFGKPLNAHCEGIFDDESTKRMLKRTSKKLRDSNEQFRNANRAKGYTVPDTYIPSSKRAGIPISYANMQAIKNFSSLGTPQKLLKAIGNGRIEDVKSVSNGDFADYYNDYERFIYEVKSTLEKPDLEDMRYLSCALDFYRMQRKLRIDVIAEIACYMDTHNIKKIPIKHSRIFWSILYFDDRRIEPSQVLTFNHAIPIVFSEKTQYMDKEAAKWRIMRIAQSDLAKLEFDKGLYNKVTIPLAANFFREHYKMLEQRTATAFGTLKNPNNQRIRLARQIMNAVYTRSK